MIAVHLVFYFMSDNHNVVCVCVVWAGVVIMASLKDWLHRGGWGPQSGGFTGLLSSHPFRIVLIPVSSSPVLALPSLLSVNTQPLGYKYNSHLQRKTIRNAKANSVPFERLSLQTMCFKTSFMQMMQLKKALNKLEQSSHWPIHK